MSRDLRSKGLRPPPKSVKRFVEKQHYHGCTNCNRKYICGCAAPEINSICNDCRQGRDTFIMAGANAAPCCAHRRPADRDILERYSLVGNDPWWHCRTCARSFTSAGSNT